MRQFLIGLLGGAGVLHFLRPEPFDSIVPKQVPGSARFWTYASGVGELACAGLLAAPQDKARRAGGLATAALMVAVWPANFQMAVDWNKKTWWHKAIGWGRLPLQLPLISGGWKIWKDPQA